MSSKWASRQGELQSPGSGSFFGERIFGCRETVGRKQVPDPLLQDFAILLQSPGKALKKRGRQLSGRECEAPAEQRGSLGAPMARTFRREEAEPRRFSARGGAEIAEEEERDSNVSALSASPREISSEARLSGASRLGGSLALPDSG